MLLFSLEQFKNMVNLLYKRVEIFIFYWADSFANLLLRTLIMDKINNLGLGWRIWSASAVVSFHLESTLQYGRSALNLQKNCKQLKNGTELSIFKPIKYFSAPVTPLFKSFFLFLKLYMYIVPSRYIEHAIENYPLDEILFQKCTIHFSHSMIQ